MAEPSVIQCPSAQPDWAGARVFAIVSGEVGSARAAYLDEALPVSPELMALAGPVAPTEVFRMAAPCASSRCQHFDAGATTCRLARKSVVHLPVVVHKAPPCAIRRDCRWWVQEGVAACQRCPQVVTLDYAPSDAVRFTTDPAQ